MTDLEELKAKAEEALRLEREAVPGPWINYLNEIAGGYQIVHQESSLPQCHPWLPEYKTTVDFIAASRTLVPLLAEGVLELIEKLAVAEEALEFYGTRKHLEIDSHGGEINFDRTRRDWRIGPPYLKSAEYGQRAIEALNKIRGEK